MASLRQARHKLEELGYDPLEALVEIAQNRNQLSELRVRAAVALLPYVYSLAPQAEVDENSGVVIIPAAPEASEWERAYRKYREEQQKQQQSAESIVKEERERHAA